MLENVRACRAEKYQSCKKRMTLIVETTVGETDSIEQRNYIADQYQ